MKIRKAKLIYQYIYQWYQTKVLPVCNGTYLTNVAEQKNWHCDKRHKRHAIMRVVALWGLSIMTFVAFLMFVGILWLLNYNVCRLWCVSHYDVCRQLWRLSLIGLVAVSLKGLGHEIFDLKKKSSRTSYEKAKTALRNFSFSRRSSRKTYVRVVRDNDYADIDRYFEDISLNLNKWVC